MNSLPTSEQKIVHSQQQAKDQQAREKSLNTFGILMIIAQITLIVLIWVFVRVNLDPSTNLDSQRYPAFQDINVMILLGFGFLMTFIRSYAWSAIAWTFLVNAFITQFYILLQPFWQRVLNAGFNEMIITIDIVFLIKCSYAVASVLVAFGGLIGRVGPKDILIMGMVNIVGYTLNQQLVLNKIGMIDAGGSATIHAYGAYFGLTACLVLSTKIKPRTNIKTSYLSNIYGFIGTLFLWLYWPSFNYGTSAQNSFEQNQIVVNTVLALTGSVIGTYVMSALSFGNGLQMESILNATLAGGVVIGAPCAVIYRPAVAIMIGITTGIISCLCFHNLTPKLLKCIGLYDTCGVHNLHGIPGILGGIWSAIIIAFYNTGYDSAVAAQYYTGKLLNVQPNFLKQGGLQIAGTFTSVGLGIAFGLIGGLIARGFYTQNNKWFYLDTAYFQEARFNEIYKDDKGINRYLKVDDNTSIHSGGGVIRETQLRIQSNPPK